MTVRKTLPLLLIVLFCTMVSQASSAIKAGYWPAWSASSFPPAAVDTSLFTHILYAFVAINPVSYRLTIPQQDDILISNFTSTMRSKNPPVKILLSIGGGAANSSTYALMAANPTTRRNFIDSTIEVARNYRLDGLDLDWEYPADTRQMTDLAQLWSEWRVAVDEEARTTGQQRLLLTAAVYYASEFLVYGERRSYPAASVAKNLDWINVMNFEYRGSWDTSATGAHAALYDPTSNTSTSFGLDSWVRAGVPSAKVVMGLPLYGHTWKLKDSGVHGIGAPAIGVGPGDEGTMDFAEVVDYNAANNAVVVYDETTVSTYSYAGTAWIGYDDETSVAEKIQFAVGRSLGGYFFWAISYDKDWRISRQASKSWGS